MDPFVIALGVILAVLVVAVPILLVRWIFRIDTIVDLLQNIRDELRKGNVNRK